MRSLGVSEEFITGNASDKEKFLTWAKAVPQTVRNPLFHWTHLELKNVFGISEYLNEKNAESVYERCNTKLQTPDFTTQSILSSFKVAYVGTTDEPWDSLEHHKKLAAENSSIRMAPSFRPDKLLMIDQTESFFKHLGLLEKASGIGVKDISSLLEALQNRIDFFHANGCMVSDHGLIQLPRANKLSAQLEREFTFLVINRKGRFSDPDAFMGYILTELCKMYHKKDWVQQFHLGPIRNNNTRLNQRLGADS
ncbi:MAG: glucuronate isomerase, partial [Bacteroidota bacterium]